ncbi:MAG: type II toxin-antitoxin system HicA family toxin [Xenococcaceae cyanobacterium]
MPKKIRELKAILKKAGFICLKDRGKGSHTVWEHPNVKNNVILSGKDGKDAQSYQEKRVEEAVKEAKNHE